MPNCDHAHFQPPSHAVNVNAPSCTGPSDCFGCA